MFTVVRISYLNTEWSESAALRLDKEWCFGFVCSDKNKLKKNTVIMDV